VQEDMWCDREQLTDRSTTRRSASTAAKRTRHGLRSPLASTYALTALPTTATSVFTFPSFGLLISTVCFCLPDPYLDAPSLTASQNGNGINCGL